MNYRQCATRDEDWTTSYGNTVKVGTPVRLLPLSGQWLEELPAEEKNDAISMIGQIFEVEDVDEYGKPWVRKSWPNEAEGRCHAHAVALEADEMEAVSGNVV